jgi:hypothetical protein
MDMDRKQAGHSGADGYASHGVFGKRRVKDSPGSEPLLQAASGSLNGLMVINIEAEKEHARVALHFLGDAFAERIHVAQHA